MAKIVRIRQGKQVRKSETFDDTQNNGPVMEVGTDSLEQDLNNIRTQISRIMNKTLQGRWFDTPTADLLDLLALSSRRYQQSLTGVINGVNTVFVADTKFRHDDVRNEMLYYNGMTLTEGAGNDYVASESVLTEGYDIITMEFAPLVGDLLKIDFTPV